MNKFIVSRAIECISINCKEYLLDKDNNLMKFNSEAEAKDFLAEYGIYDCFEVEEDEEEKELN